MEALPTILRDFFAEVPTLTLATVDDDNHPHAANLNFVADRKLNLLFVSKPGSEHCLHLAKRPDVAVTAYAPFTSPRTIRGIQLRGTCEALDPALFDARWRLFVSKHTAAAAFEAMVRREEAFFRIRPRWIRWIDNSVRFGFKAETNWPPPGSRRS